MSEREMITTTRQPVRLTFKVHAGRQMSHYLSQIADRNIIGRRAESGLVYVPPIGADPMTGKELGEEVRISDHGTVTTFCIVNFPFEGQQLDPPYALSAILLDGADLPIFHMLGNVDAADVHMGMRVKATWRDADEFMPSMENIVFFEPSGEPDAEYDSYKEHI